MNTANHLTRGLNTANHLTRISNATNHLTWIFNTANHLTRIWNTATHLTRILGTATRPTQGCKYTYRSSNLGNMQRKRWLLGSSHHRTSHVHHFRPNHFRMYHYRGSTIVLVQAGGEDVITALTTICNRIWQTGEWPTPWTQSLVITLPKKGILQHNNQQSVSSVTQANSQPHQSPKQSHAEDHTE